MPATLTYSFSSNYQEDLVNLITIAWTSDGSGNVSASITGPEGATISGTLLQAAFKPGTSGSQPDNSYDVTITNAAGVDVLGGIGANLSNSNASQETPKTTNGFPYVLSGPLTLSVSGAGATKTGTIYLMIR